MMALLLNRPRFFSLLLCLVSSISYVAGGTIGVDYGRDANNLMSPDKVVNLLKANGIGAAAIYDADPTVIQAFARSGIKLVVALPNEQLAAATNPDYAGTWVWEHVGKYYPATQIQEIAVGNEVFHQRPDLTSSLLPAMNNVYNALVNLGRANDVKVSSPVAFSALSKSFPPSQGSFRSDLQPVLRQMLDFLRRTGSRFMVNLYPYITYMDNPNIDLNYALGLPNSGVQDPATKLTYFSLLDAQIDSVYSAMGALGYGNTVATMAASDPLSTSLLLKETGHPSGSERKNPKQLLTGRKVVEGADTVHGTWNASLLQRGPNKENAQAYNSNLVQRIVSGKTGTPLRPNGDLDVYIFSLFNENLKKGPATERSFGLFYPDGTPVYSVNFGAGSWCVANTAAGQQKLQAALDWACGAGGADCGPIQRGGSCYEPNTLEVHASYAMNSYYQKNGRAASACDFSGAGRVVNQRPRFGNCELP